MKKRQQINLIGSIGEDLVEGIRDITHILEGMRDEIELLKEKVNNSSSDKTNK